MGVRRATAVCAVALFVAAATAVAGPRGQWTRLPGTVINFAEPGLARTPDGVLHVVYVRRNGTKSELVHVPVSPNGKTGSAAVALSGWSTMSHPDLLRMLDGTLRVFFGGIRGTSPGDPNNALNTATAPSSGRPWTLQPGRAAQATYAYATSTTGAGLAKDGTPISTWSGTPGLGFHYGVDPADPDQRIPQSGCCLYNPEIAVDAVSGQAWVGFHSLETDSKGLYVHAIGPGGPQGTRKLAPGSRDGKNSAQPGNRTAITGRIGAPGVYLLFGQGYPTFKTLALWRVDRARPHLVLKLDRNEHANVAPAPEGRLWLFWERSGTIQATRTNKAATRVGPVTSLTPPGEGSVFRLNGEGSVGPLDLVANVNSGGAQAMWHQQVWPKLHVTARRTGTSLAIRVFDAGDPVAGAVVRLGGRSVRTAANGRATVRSAPKGRVKATATKAGYVPASATVR